MRLVVTTMEQDGVLPKKTGRPLSFDRDHALQQAMLQFWQSGYETTSVSDLTSAMGITPPSLYAAFGDKQRLFLEAMHLYAGSPYAMDEALSEAATALDAVRTMMTTAAYAFTGETTPKGCLLASATASGSSASRDVQQAVSNIRLAIRRRIADRIALDVERGLLPKDADPHALAAMVVAVIQGMSVLARDGVERQVLLDLAELSIAGWPGSQT